MGPDETLGYVIAKAVPSNSITSPAGINASIAFERSSALTDESFLVLSNIISKQNHTLTSDAVSWLNSNGYWTSYVLPTPTPTVTPSALQIASVTGATTNGGVYTTSLSPFSSGTSYKFNGTNGYLSYPASADYNLGTGDFTIEWFQYQTSQPNNPRVFEIGVYPSISIGVSIETLNSIFYLWAPGANNIKSFTGNTILNTWIHFAIVRIGTSLKVYQNGTQIGSTLTNSNSLGNSTQTLSIGQETTATTNSYFPGYITQFRWTKGLGIYTGNFTTPTGPLNYTASANPFGGSNTSAISSGYVKLLLQ
jgi:Concanavalin A-like lectin/glucanases superfamily